MGQSSVRTHVANSPHRNGVFFSESHWTRHLKPKCPPPNGLHLSTRHSKVLTTYCAAWAFPGWLVHHTVSSSADHTSGPVCFLSPQVGLLHETKTQNIQLSLNFREITNNYFSIIVPQRLHGTYLKTNKQKKTTYFL